MSEKVTKEKKSAPFYKRLLLGALVGKKDSQIIAYTAVVTAFVVVANFFEVEVPLAKFSLTIFVAAIAGILIGPLMGSVAAFFGDMLEFFAGGGSGYSPWIGVGNAAIALLAGLIIGGLKSRQSWFLYVKLGLVCVLTFLICTVAINTTAMWLLWYRNSFPSYWGFLSYRLFGVGGIWNSLANYALLFAAVPALNRIKPLKLNVR